LPAFTELARALIAHPAQHQSFNFFDGGHAAHILESAEELNMPVLFCLGVQAGFKRARGLEARHGDANQGRRPRNADAKHSGLHLDAPEG
jgi:hypothetical protein